MATAGLKRSSSSDLDPHSDISSPFWPSNKRHCTTNYSPLNKRPNQTQSPPPNKRHCTADLAPAATTTTASAAPTTSNNLHPDQIELHQNLIKANTNQIHSLGQHPNHHQHLERQQHQQQHHQTCSNQRIPFSGDSAQSDGISSMMKSKISDESRNIHANFCDSLLLESDQQDFALIEHIFR